jgi:hypothetical protein
MEGVDMGSKYTEKEHALWRSLVLPQEEIHRLTTWRGKGYRWFQSANVIPIEQWERDPEPPAPSQKEPASP